MTILAGFPVYSEDRLFVLEPAMTTELPAGSQGPTEK